ncbi:MAG: LPS-assembly protein LptD [Helicobacter sp.]|nr:LPS-assembly protein LptD [Helicobacter sp.]
MGGGLFLKFFAFFLFFAFAFGFAADGRSDLGALKSFSKPDELPNLHKNTHLNIPKNENEKNTPKRSGLIQNNSKNQKVFDLQADILQTKGNVISAKENVSLILEDLYVLADLVIYDKDLRKLTISGNVKLYKSNTLFAQTKSLVINLSQDFSVITPFYMQDFGSGMWVASDFASALKDVYNFEGAMLSGCSIDEPIWHVSVSSGSYDSKDNVFSLWNPTLYVGDVPVFYSPYLLFSVNRTRKSGILFPDFGSSNRDGFIYAQPYFLALQDFWDATLAPQLRTSKGIGGSVEFRAVNSYNERISANVKYFYNFKDYVARYNLRNNYIFGFDVRYQTLDWMQKYAGININSGAFFDFLYMNDLDYLRLEKFNARITDGTRISKANAYIQDNDNFLAIYLRYFLNLNKINNDTTFQTIPNVQYHRFTNSLFWDNLIYSLDLSANNTTRKNGFGYIESELRLPFGLQAGIFGDYLTLGAKANIYASSLSLNNAQNSYISPGILKAQNISPRHGSALNATYLLHARSDLARDYEDFFHVIELSSQFSGPLFRKSNNLLSDVFFSQHANEANFNALKNEYSINGKSYADVWNPSFLDDLIPYSNVLTLSVNQYFYSDNRELFNVRLSQILNLDRFNPKVQNSLYTQPLEGKVTWTPTNSLEISSIFSYSILSQGLEELSFSANYNQDYTRSSLTYYVKNNLSNLKDQNIANYMNFSFSSDFGIFGLNSAVNLNLNNLASADNHAISDVLTNWSVGIFKNIRCFGFGLKVVNQKIPILVNDATGNFASSTLDNTYLKFDFSFAPLSNVGLTYRFYNQ